MRFAGHITVEGPPPTKKNSQRLVYFGLGQPNTRALRPFLERLQKLVLMNYKGRVLNQLKIAITDAVARLLPNADYEDAARWTIPQMRVQWKGKGIAQVGDKTQPVHLKCVYYLPAKKSPDLLSLMEATADLLEDAQVLANDYWIVNWDGTRRDRDIKRPRTEIDIFVYEKGVDL